MKLSSTITQLPIFGMNEGAQLAICANLYVNRKTKKVEYLSVLKNADDVFPGIIAFDDVKGIGNNFIVVMSENSIKKLPKGINLSKTMCLVNNEKSLYFQSDVFDEPIFEMKSADGSRYLWLTQKSGKIVVATPSGAW